MAGTTEQLGGLYDSGLRKWVVYGMFLGAVFLYGPGGASLTWILYGIIFMLG